MAGTDAEDLVAALRGERLPAMLVDLDAFDRNVARVAEAGRALDLPVRLATKSIRVPELIDRALERGGPTLRGLLCYAAREAELLAARGHDDLLVAYPPWQSSDLDALVRVVNAGKRIAVAVDGVEAVDRWSEAMTRARTRTPIRLVACVDMSLRIGARVHLGVRRSPIHSPDDVVALARHARSKPNVSFAGILGYEAQIAGVADDAAHEGRLVRGARTLMKRASMRELGKRRRAMVEALRAEGFELEIVNGGGTGSLEETTLATGVTETTAGSALFKPHLFDGYRSATVRALEPACFFALEVTRRPAAGLVTCLGGGYVASGPPSVDRIPRPVWPLGCELLPMEMTGEVQTPLRVPASVTLRLGDAVLFRHAKAGELAERFDEALLVSEGVVLGRAKTYRGEGATFF